MGSAVVFYCAAVEPHHGWWCGVTGHDFDELAYPVDSEVFTLPDGQTVIGRDAYEAELTRRVFRRFGGGDAA